MDTYAKQAKVFKAFCDVNRLQILELLRSEGKMRLCAVGAFADWSVDTVLSHENFV